MDSKINQYFLIFCKIRYQSLKLLVYMVNCDVIFLEEVCNLTSSANLYNGIHQFVCVDDFVCRNEIQTLM